MLITRYVKFVQNIRKSPKLAVQFMLEKTHRNVNTVTGSNFRFINDRIGHDCDILNVKPSFLRSNVKFSEIREDDRWRVNIIREIVNINQNVLDLKHNDDAFLSSEQLNEILEYVSIS